MNESEKKVVTIMIHMYCRSKHGKKDALCYDCNELRTYALSRLEHCPYGEDKPTCNTCPIHCYKSDMRARIKKVMRFSGSSHVVRPSHRYVTTFSERIQTKTAF